MDPSGWDPWALLSKFSLICDVVHSGAFWRRIGGSLVSIFVYIFVGAEREEPWLRGGAMAGLT